MNLHGSSALLNKNDLYRTQVKVCSSKINVLACRSCFKYFTSSMLNVRLLISKWVYVPEVQMSDTCYTLSHW